MLEYLKKAPFTLYSIWNEIIGTSAADGFEMTATIDNETYYIIKKEWFNNAIKRRYLDRLYYSEYDNISQVAAQFAEDFTIWKAETLANWQKALAALVASYNPIENYDSHETIETEHGHVVETEHGLETETSYGKVDTNVNTPTNATITTTNSQYGYNSTAAVPSDVSESVKSGTETDERTLSGSDTVTNSGTDTVTNSGKDTITTTKHGNIGVTTAAQMITEELRLRMYNLAEKAINTFVNTCTIY